VTSCARNCAAPPEAYGLSPAPEAIAVSGVRHQQITLSSGITLHVAQTGDERAPLMLFMHGFPEYWQAWETQLNVFGARGFHAVAPDLRGFNLSDQPTDLAAYRPRHLVADIAQLIAALGAKDCVLVAHDWGGALAWNLSAQLPHLVRKLIIINSPHPALFARELTHNEAQIAASAYMNALRASDSEARFAENDFALMVRFLTGMGEARWFTPEVQARYKACWARGLTGGMNFYRASPLHPATATEPGASAVQLSPESVTVRVPTLVIWGEADQALLPGLLDGLEDYVPKLSVRRLPRGSHWVVHEYPKEVSAMMSEFVAG
jgi:epoxide hydrolase 4